MGAIVVLEGDQHVNALGTGLCPPVVVRDDGSNHRPGKTVKAIYRARLQAWKYVAELKARHKAILYAVLGGDAGDYNGYDRASLISQMKTTIYDMMVEVFAPVAEVADHLFVIRGTTSHGGVRNELDEWLADDLGAEPDPETGSDSWWHLPLEIEGVTFDLMHHPQTAARYEHTWPAAAARHAMLIRYKYLGQGEMPPDVAVRFHTHHYQPGLWGYKPFFAYAPGWQLCTPYGYRLGHGALVEPVGLLIYICEAGQVTLDDSQIFRPRKRKPWKPKN